MPDRFQVYFADSAKADMRDIIEWYDSLNAPAVGRRLVAQVIGRIEQLATFPDSGRVVQEFDIAWLRELEMAPFRIVYKRDEDALTVIRVWRSERLMARDPSHEILRLLACGDREIAADTGRDSEDVMADARVLLADD